MKRFLSLFYLLQFTFYLASAQTTMRDVFAQLPDSVLPYMSQNNRLDCIDFFENGMEARVKNRLDEPVVLTSLTTDFLSIETSTASTVEMKLVPSDSDTLICVSRTYMGPTPDSDVRLYTLGWTFVERLPRPAVAEFLIQRNHEPMEQREQTSLLDLPSRDRGRRSQTTKQRNHETADTLRTLQLEAEYLPLIKAELSPTQPTITWTLQTAELTKETKKAAGKYLRPIVKRIR